MSVWCFDFLKSALLASGTAYNIGISGWQAPGEGKAKTADKLPSFQQAMRIG